MPRTYKIGEAAALLNLKTYVLRFWETEFPDVVPLRTDKGQRLYTRDNLALLERIRYLLHERGLTIEGARKILQEDKEKGLAYSFLEDAHPLPAPDAFGVQSAFTERAEGRATETPHAPLPPAKPSQTLLRELTEELSAIAGLLRKT